MNVASLNRLLERIAQRQDLALVALLVVTMVMMILPMPTVFADILIAINIALSVLLMMVAIYINGPVEFSTLPTVILITTAFRLSLSITTSRMVLVQADAGEIIRTFGEFVIAGNIVVGLVVYLIITIVQFVVITKGSERVAEVAARFTLDALPGKQISIDTDLKNGDIDQKEARRRRRLLEKESQLYGAMDGAMKFVKGDAIASLVIIVVNLVGGMAIGILQRGLSFADAVHTYSLLAVGDGLIAQIPALLISLTAGVIVTRVTSATGGNLSRDIVSQITAEPRVLQVASAVLAGLALVPGFPVAVFLTLSVVIGAGGWALSGRRRRDDAAALADAAAIERGGPEAATLVVKIGRHFDASSDEIAAALGELRQEMATRLGIRVPPINLVRDASPAMAWSFELDGIPVANGMIDPDQQDTGATADAARTIAAMVRVRIAGLAGQFVGIQETQALITAMEVGYADLVREALKGAPLPRLAEVLRRLVDEGVPVTNMRIVLETVAEWGVREQNTALLAEQVRVALRRHICHGLAGPDKTLSLVLIDGIFDEALRGAVHMTPNGSQLVLDPVSLDRLVAGLRTLVDPAIARGVRLAILSSTELRRHLRSLLARRGLLVPVLSHNELASEFQVQLIATFQQGHVAPVPVPDANQEAARLALIGVAA